MLHDVILPKSGIYTDDVELVEWKVDEGARVEPGDPLFEMATDKIEMDVEADVAGWVHRLAEDGASLPIGTRIGVVATSLEEYEELTR